MTYVAAKYIQDIFSRLYQRVVIQPLILRVFIAAKGIDRKQTSVRLSAQAGRDNRTALPLPAADLDNDRTHFRGGVLGELEKLRALRVTQPPFNGPGQIEGRA